MCRAKYYEAKVKDRKKCKPAQWWKEIKQLSGFSKVERANPFAGLEDPKHLANVINDALLSPMSAFTPLATFNLYAHTHTHLPESPRPISEFSVFKKLSTVGVMLFDFKKAFDLIDHSILMAKLEAYELPPWVPDWIAYFRTDRKLAYNSYLDWGSVQAGVPQETKLGPWVFLVMINDIKVSSVNVWKYYDDTSIAETVHNCKGQPSGIQVAVDDLVKQAEPDKFQLNETKCKELQISFSRSADSFKAVAINNKAIEVVTCVKLLGLTIRNNLKWNAHIYNGMKKGASRLYQIKQLKRAKVDP